MLQSSGTFGEGTVAELTFNQALGLAQQVEQRQMTRRVVFPAPSHDIPLNFGSSVRWLDGRSGVALYARILPKVPNPNVSKRPGHLSIIHTYMDWLIDEAWRCCCCTASAKSDHRG